MHRCEICLQDFTQRGVLMRHIRTVHGNPQYQCALCGTSFTRITLYNTHIKSQEGCPHCQHICCGKRALTHHVKVMHGKKPQPVPVIHECERIPDQTQLFETSNQPPTSVYDNQDNMQVEIPDKIFTAVDVNTGLFFIDFVVVALYNSRFKKNVMLYPSTIYTHTFL